MIVLLLGGGCRPEEMLATPPINNTGYTLYLISFVFLLILTLVSMKYAQIIVPIFIIILIIAELFGIVYQTLMLDIGFLTMYIPISILQMILFNFGEPNFTLMSGRYAREVSLILFNFALVNFHLLVMAYCKVVGSKGLFIKAISGVPLAYILLTSILMFIFGHNLILLWAALAFLFYMFSLWIPIILYGGINKISDERIKKWFKIAFFVPIIGPILFLIVFRNTEIASADDAGPENTDSE